MKLSKRNHLEIRSSHIIFWLTSMIDNVKSNIPIGKKANLSLAQFLFDLF